MWQFHCTDASRKCSEGNKKMLLFPPYYAPPLLQQGPVWHFPSSWGESSPPDNESERSDKKVGMLEDHEGKVCQPDRQGWGAKTPRPARGERFCRHHLWRGGDPKYSLVLSEFLMFNAVFIWSLPLWSSHSQMRAGFYFPLSFESKDESHSHVFHCRWQYDSAGG